MNFQNKSSALKIVFRVGDESGIGPEVILKALSSDELPENIELLLFENKVHHLQY